MGAACVDDTTDELDELDELATGAACVDDDELLAGLTALVELTLDVGTTGVGRTVWVWLAV